MTGGKAGVATGKARVATGKARKAEKWEE